MGFAPPQPSNFFFWKKKILVLFFLIIFFSLLDTKEAEAAQSAYFDPSRPQTAYVPPPAYYVSVFFY